MSNNNILFDANSGAMDSPVFLLDKQITVIATGMAPDDYITFEVLQLLSGDPAKLCGCRLTAASMATIELVKPLTCSMCGPEVNSQEVRLTDNNTFVILDAPQGALLRAIYHGTGVDDGTAKVWYNTSDTPDLNDAMRGCAPMELWEDTGETRCNVAGDILEIQQSSSCGGIRWVDGPALTWVATGETRCNTGLSIIEVQEVNNCGDFRWVAGAAFEWVNTGLQDCSAADGFVLAQQVSPCGDLRWVNVSAGEGNLAVEWLPTGEMVCEGAALLRQERNQCGDFRLVDAGLVEWVPTGEISCEWIPRAEPVSAPQYTVNTQEINSCGVLRWVNDPTPVNAVYSGVKECFPSVEVLAATYMDACGGFELQVFYPAPGEYWTRTGQISCNAGEIILLEEQDFCGNRRWIEDPAGTPAWHDAGGDCSYVCDADTGFLFRVQQSACCNGSERLVQVFVDSELGPEPVLPEWLSTGVYRCNSETGMVELQERSQCNEYRWTACSAITWVATGETRILNGNSQFQLGNQCGEVSWQDIPPESIVWTLTGVQACVGGFYQNQETDGFGNVRTVATTEPCGCENPILQSSYDSGWQLYTGRRGQPGFVDNMFTFAHGLGIRPEFVTLEWRCVNAQGGYTAGNIVVANVHSADQQGGAATGWAMQIDDINVQLAFDYNNGASLHEWNGNGNFRPRNLDWEFRIRGYA